jgi:uncharacterized protein (DUF4415 family)
VKKGEHITRITLDEAHHLVAEGKSQTDWAKVAATTEAELEAAIRDDPDEGEAHLHLDWTKAIKGIPSRKEMVNMRLDREILDYFRAGGKGYQSRINAVLRGFVESAGRAA